MIEKINEIYTPCSKKHFSALLLFISVYPCESAALNSKSAKDALMLLINCSSGKSFYFKKQKLTK